MRHDTPQRCIFAKGALAATAVKRDTGETGRTLEDSPQPSGSGSDAPQPSGSGGSDEEKSSGAASSEDPHDCASWSSAC